METTTAETLSPVTPPAPKRTIFLTVICILSFIGSSWGILSSMDSYFSAETQAVKKGGILQNAQNQFDSKDSLDFTEKIINSVSITYMAENIRKIAVCKFISNLLTLCGALLMFNLRKVGFFLYIVGIAVLISQRVMIVNSFIGLFKAVEIGFLTGFFGIVFIIMYGLNLKCMTK